MEHATQEQKAYEVSQVDVGNLITELTLPGGTGMWDGENVPEHIMAISIGADPEPREKGMLLVTIVYVHIR